VIKAKNPIAFGATGVASAGYQHALVLKNMLDANLKVIVGFPSVKDVGLALERDEVQAACAMYVSTVKSAFASEVRDGKFKFLVQFGHEDVPFFQGAPNFYRMIKTEEDRQVAELFFGPVEIARPLIGPPDMPAPILAALRNAMTETLRDKALLTDAAKLSLDIEPMSGEQTQKAFARFFRSSPSVVKRAIAIMERKQ
jgi:tripartite-type tricarboxylate transporter receptor subunit TctC